MDLIAILRSKINVLEDGEYMLGLKAVLIHIETAYRHLLRGQESGDDTAFTDTIYRTNQAFEGSIKEAYRVLADKNPSRKSPSDIESYLLQNNIFRPRVLTQFTRYRTEWRNPSAHDYTLDFDASESLLAITSVSAFSWLLLDQIAERLSFIKAQREADIHKPESTVHDDDHLTGDLFMELNELLPQFFASHISNIGLDKDWTERQLIGGLHGFLSSAAPGLLVSTEELMKDTTTQLRPDLIVSRGEEKVILEIKRRLSRMSYQNGIVQIERYLQSSGIKDGILLFPPDKEPRDLDAQELLVGSSSHRVSVLFPKGLTVPVL